MLTRLPSRRADPSAPNEHHCSFPTGLSQPAGGFHFGLDALLLVSFVHAYFPDKATKVCDLGTGCGVCLIGLGLLRPETEGLGIDYEAESLLHAEKNFLTFGFEKRFALAHRDLKETEYLRPLSAQFHVVLANPPYYTSSEARVSKTAQRTRALLGEDALEHFCHAATLLLRNKAHLFLIYPATKLQALLATLRTYHLGLQWLLPVAPRGAKTNRILICARKNVCEKTTILPPLLLYQEGNTFTSEAKQFCPWL